MIDQLEDRDITWWLSRLDRVQASSSGWTAICPSHADIKSSLSLKIADDGGVLVNCFAGCQYHDIIEAISSTVPTIVTYTTAPLSVDSRAWWEGYTGIPSSKWESWGARFDGSHIFFTWDRTRVMKSRRAGTKEFSWTPNASTPPLWPSIPEILPSTIFITEGESDCGVLRFIGLPAWAITKGVKTPGLDRSFSILQSRGVKKIVSVLDLDSAGSEGSSSIAEICFGVGLEYSMANINSIVDPLLGEKDLRDAWLRTQDPNLIRRTILDSVAENSRVRRRRVDIREFLESPVETSHWLVKDVFLEETVGMLVGAPKVGKSWMAHDLGISVATGTPFLDRFECANPGPVVIITKEDPDYLLQDRLEKILLSKGLGGFFDSKTNVLSFPQQSEIPLYLDLTRTFLFDDHEAGSLLTWLRQIKDLHGRIALIIFDPTLRMLSGVDEFKATEIGGSVFRIAQRIQTEMGCGVMLVHHRSKGGTEGKSSYGSMAFHAFSESTIYIKGEPDQDGWLNVETEFKSAPQGKWAYRFPELEQRYVVQVSDDEIAKPTGAIDQTASSILRLLTSITTGLSVPEIVEAIPNASDFMVRKSLKVLESMKKIERSKAESSSPTGGKRGDVWKIKEKANDSD